MEDREQERANDELRLPEDRVEDLEPDNEESSGVAGGKLPGKRTPPTVT